MFGLETNMEIDALVTLEWDKANELCMSGMLSKIAHDVLRLMPRHLGSPYVFLARDQWRRCATLRSLAGARRSVRYEWSELRNAYRTVIKLDLNVERLAWLKA
ncbi:hypothetical protein AX768_02140 [Burkholderia sp. PAMC 28687]|uniref:hypothetical protein n=1 Tax=Burkholderia sp. PAMC 28687 TaxID=1795874 RepID=UPI00078024D7|nr:hypothetical protein [Burkholderia sp. PAMC 28687]AMM13090.1 hypothetical protein AX768_02140 [Burkholderia sp. PAMC 28687]